MPPLHAAFFNRSYYPDTSATGQLLTELCESLAREYGLRVSVVAGVPLLPARSGAAPLMRGLLCHREMHNGVEILRAHGTRFSKRRFAGRFANYLSYFLCACWAALRLRRADVVVALTDPPIVGLASWLAARRSSAPLVMSYRDVFPEAGRLLEDFRSPFVESVLERVNRFLLCRAETIVVIGETMARRLVEGKGADPRKLACIHDWADCSAITPAPKANDFSRAHGFDGKFVVMHSGNIGLAQNLDTLLAAADLLRDEPGMMFVFVGEGVKKMVLEQRADSLGLTNVRFLPFQPKQKLTESFAAADVFYLSLKPGLAGYLVPSKLYGFLAAGRPCIAAVEEECEAAAIVREHGCGLLARPDDPQDVAEKLLAVFRDGEAARQMGDNARRAAAKFDRPVAIAAYAGLLRDVAAKAVPRAPLLKRPFDVALSALGLVLSAPLWPLLALLIRLEDGGPVFYSQERVGRLGRRFRSRKFRTMRRDADAPFGPRQAAVNDPRVTPVGRLLRATALDELPQLWSIFTGRMSFVGPRPLVPEETEVNATGAAVALEDVPGYRERQLVRPGLTGLAQVYAHRNLPRRQKFRYDRLYVRRQSLCLDLKLIALSFGITFRAAWESPGRIR